MYILELLYSLWRKEKKTHKTHPLKIVVDEDLDNSEECDHFFMPLDSSNEIFACKNCGIVVSKEELNNKFK